MRDANVRGERSAPGRPRGQTLQATQQHILELTAENRPLSEALDAIVRAVEDMSSTGTLASVLLLDEDGERLRHGAAPSLPAAYNAAIDGVGIGPAVGSCGTAAFRREPVYVADIQADPLWTDFRTLAAEHDLRACWSTPVLSAAGDLLGTFALYHREPREPTPEDIAAVAFVVRSTALLIERKRAEAALRESEARYRALFEAVDAGFCVIEVRFDEDGQAVDYRHVETNPAFDRQTGLHDHLNRWVSELVPGLERHWFDIYGEVVRTGRPVRFENNAEPLGRCFDVHAFRTGEPGHYRVAVLFNDISQRKRAEKRLRELNETLEGQIAERTAELRFNRDIIEATTSPICAFDTDYRLIAFNRAHSDEFFRIFAHRVQLGEVFPDLFPPEQAPVIRGFMARALAGETYTVVEEFGDPDLAKPYWEVNYTPLRDEAGRVVGAFHLANDITARLRAAAELKDAQEALRQSQKMEAVGQLTGGLAHDFNNLLAGISGSLELMQTRISQGRVQDVDRYMVAAQGAARRAAALTHRLLAFSRRQTLDPRPTDVNRLITGMQDLVQRTVGPGIAVETVGASGIWPVMVDPPQLENALLNLCINARDAMTEGGRLTIETANKWLDRAAAARHDMPEGQYLSLCVTDTGTGMSPDLIARAFEPFFTTKPIGEGTGLGLSMIYGFARQSGGQVRIYSEVGQGSTVCIYLPRHYGDVSDEPAAGSALPLDRSDQGETVVVVDDEPTVRMLITEILGDLGYVALEAGDSAAGLKLLQAAPRVDLLVTDVGLPGGMNGRQMADAARVTRPDLKVLFITGYAENAVIGDRRLEPGMSVLTKPFAVDAMAARIWAMVAGG